MTGSAAFFDPDADNAPCRRRPPQTIKLSKRCAALEVHHGVCAEIFTAWSVPSAISDANGA